MRDEGIRPEEQTRPELSSASKEKQQPDGEGQTGRPAAQRPEGQPGGTDRPRASKAMSVAAVLASLALVTAALAAVMIAAGFAMNSRYVSVEGTEDGFVVDSWNDTVVIVEGGAASIVPLDVSDSKTVPGGLLWGDFDDEESTTELHYTSGRLRYQFATEELNVALVAIDENFADAVQLIDSTTDDEEPIGISFSGAVEADQGSWGAISAVRTQYR